AAGQAGDPARQVGARVVGTTPRVRMADSVPRAARAARPAGDGGTARGQEVGGRLSPDVPGGALEGRIGLAGPDHPTPVLRGPLGPAEPPRGGRGALAENARRASRA